MILETKDKKIIIEEKCEDCGSENLGTKSYGDEYHYYCRECGWEEW
jgi:uncharacterized Zn finger protein|tara:strand:+ start:1648 stop:1785 length:138 start_codon:yes stop_codon:yes gene_type:complete